MEYAHAATGVFPIHVWAPRMAYGLLLLLLVWAVLRFVVPVSHYTRLTGRGTLRGSLVLGLALVATVPLLSLGVILAERSAHARIDRIAARAEEAAAMSAFSVDQFIDKHVSGMTSAASAISSSGDDDMSRMPAWLRQYHRVYDDFLTMLYADRSGDIKTATSNMSGFLTTVPDLTGYNIRDREYFIRAIADEKTFVSSVFQGRDLGNDPIVAISAPIRDETGQATGIIEGSLDLGAFSRIDSDRIGLEGAELVLVDQQNRVIYATPSTGYGPLVNVASIPLVRSAADQEGMQAYSWEADDNARFLGAYARAETGWTAYLRVPLSGVYSQMSRDYVAAMLFALVACAVALLFGLAIVRRSSESLDDMNEAIDRLSLDRDDDEIRTPANTFEEFRPIFRHMRRRAKQLRKTYQRLQHSIAAGQKLQADLNQAISTKEAEIHDRTRDLEEANRRLHTQSRVDSLTGIANRRKFRSFVERIWRVVERDQADAALIMLDIDHFKRYNDGLGHQAGDECLKLVAGALSGCASRPLDLVARYGGEEFIAVLGNTNMDQALIVAERMRRAVEDLAIEHPDSRHDVVTISVGVATVATTPDPTAEHAIQRADSALYIAKDTGRNCVVYPWDGEFLTFDATGIDLAATITDIAVAGIARAR